MLSYIIHSLLLLPVGFVRPLLHELLSLLPYLDRLNSVLPAANILEAEELSWSTAGHGRPLICCWIYWLACCKR